MEYVVLQTKEGYFLRFMKTEVPLKKKQALGVRGITLAQKMSRACVFVRKPDRLYGGL